MDERENQLAGREETLGRPAVALGGRIDEMVYSGMGVFWLQWRLARPWLGERRSPKHAVWVIAMAQEYSGGKGRDYWSYLSYDLIRAGFLC